MGFHRGQRQNCWGNRWSKSAGFHAGQNGIQVERGIGRSHRLARWMNHAIAVTLVRAASVVRGVPRMRGRPANHALHALPFRACLLPLPDCGRARAPCPGKDFCRASGHRREPAPAGLDDRRVSASHAPSGTRLDPTRHRADLIEAYHARHGIRQYEAACGGSRASGSEGRPKRKRFRRRDPMFDFASQAETLYE